MRWLLYKLLELLEKMEHGVLDALDTWPDEEDDDVSMGDAH